MKTANVLASALFGTLAVAAPFDKRAYVTQTVVVVETEVIYTTIWDQPAPAPSTVVPAAATTEPGLFYEQHHSIHHSSSTEAPAPPPYTPSPAPSSSSVYTPPPPPPPSSVYTPPPAPSSVYTPPPAPSSVYTPPPAPVSSSPPAQSSSTPSNTGGGNGGGESSTLQGKHSNVDGTVYDTGNAAGACSETLSDDMMIVALGYKGMGPSTYNVMTGDATMPACGQWINIENNGKVVRAQIKDKCPGCEGEWDIDCSRAVWSALGMTEDTRIKLTWWTD